MNNVLFNLYYSSSHSYKTSKNFVFFFFQLLNNFHIFIILDIIFNKATNTKKTILFPFYFLSPIFYLEHFLSQSNSNCLSDLSSDYFIPRTNDQLSLIIDFAFNNSKNLLCHYDSYIYYIGTVYLFILILFVLVLFIPSSLNNYCMTISKIFSSIIEIFYSPLLHVLFFLSTKKLIFHSNLINDSIDGYTAVWLVFTLLILLTAILYNKYTQKGHCILNYLSEDRTIEVFLSLLSALVINIRFIKLRFFFFSFFWIILFWDRCYQLAYEFIYSMFSNNYIQKCDFYMYIFFLAYGTIRLISAIIILFNGKDVSPENENVLKVIELCLGIVLFILIVIVLNVYCLKNINVVDLINHLKNDNEWGNFENVFVIFNMKFVDFFQFKLMTGGDLKDRELMTEVQKRKNEIVTWFKEQYIQEIKMGAITIPEENNTTMNNTSGIINYMNVTEEMALLQNFSSNIKKFSGKKKTNKTITKKESMNIANIQNNNEFKLIIEIVLKFIKSLKKHIVSSFWNVNQKKTLCEFLIIAKLICFCEYDDHTTRAEFYVKKYLHRKNASAKFIILMKFLDIKFREYAMYNEESIVNTIKMIQLSEKLLHLIQMFKFILEQFDLNGDTEQKRLEIIEKENCPIGDCYKTIMNYSQTNDNKYKLNENSTYAKLKIAQQLLFCNESPDKIIEETDIQLAENEFSKNNYFILMMEKDSILIHKCPAKYLEKSGFKGEFLIGQEFNIVMPKCFRRLSQSTLRKIITKEGQFKFSLYDFLLTKDNYIMRVKLNYNVLPIIGNETLVFCEVDFNIKNVNNCFVLNNKNEIIEIGQGFLTYFGIQPLMLPLSVSDIFDTSQPLQYKFLHNRHYHTIDLETNKGITINLAAYIKLYNQLIKLKGTNSDEKVFLENMQKFLDSHKIKDKDNVSLLFSQVEWNNSKYLSEAFSVYAFIFPTLTGGTSMIQNSMNPNCNVGNLGSTTNGGTSGGGVEMAMAFENKYTCCSSSSVSVSNTSLNMANASLNGQRNRNMKNKRNINIPEILETTYGLLLIIVVIVLVIVIKLLSSDLVNIFKVLKDVRSLNSLFYNGAFHVLNKIVFNHYEKYNTVELEIISKNPEITTFWPTYLKDFVNVTQEFFDQYNSFSSEIYEYLDEEFINNQINIAVNVVQNDGVKKEETFLNAINVPKLNFYFLSKTENYTFSLPFFDIHGNFSEQLANLSETESNFYVTILNYQEILDKFMDVTENIRLMFHQKFNSYKLKLYLIFSFSIFINLLSYFLYAFNINTTKKKIISVSLTFFSVNKANISFLNHKLNSLKKIIEVEEKPSNILTKMTKEIQKRKIETKNSIKQNNNTHIETKTQEPTQTSISSQQPFAKGKKESSTHKLKIYSSVLWSITISHSLFIIYAMIVIPLLSSMMNNISTIQEFTNEVSSIQKISINYYLTLQAFILLNNTEQAIENNYVDDYPSSFYDSLKTIQNYMKENDDLNLIEDYLNSLYGDELCKNLYLSDSESQMLIDICESIDILKSSWTNALSHIIRSIRNVFYNYVNSDQTEETIAKYFHDEDMQKLNIICFCFVKQLMDYIKDTNGIIIYQNAINDFVTYTIIMSVALIILEVGNFIVITGRIVKRLKTTYDNFRLIEKFFIS